MKRFAFDFTPPSEPRKIKLTLPEDLVVWYEQQATVNGGTLEAGIVQALHYIRRSQEEPEPEPETPKRRIRVRTSDHPSPTPALEA